MRSDHHAVVLAHLARQGKQLEGLLQGHGGGFHGAKQRSRTRLELVLDVLLDALFLLFCGRLGFPILGALAFFGALLVFLGALLGDDLLGLTLGLLPLILADDFGDIRAEATLLGHDHAAVFRVLAQLAAALRGGEKLFRQLLVEAIRGDGFGQVSALILDAAVVVSANGALDVRAVAAHAHEDVAALGVSVEAQGVDLARVDGFQVDVDKRLQAAVTGNGGRLLLVGLGVAEVKAVKPGGAILDTGGNLV